MEQTQPEFRQFTYYGKGPELFKIYIINWLLTIVTLGFYYPWAKAALLKYNYQHTQFDGSNFTFHGTGKEMFKGFLKVIGVIVVLYGSLLAAQLSGNASLTLTVILIFYIVLILLVPFAIHGSLRYRASRSSWRGIHFGYRGDRTTLVKLFVKDVLLTIITFGIYNSWFINDLRTYIIGNIRFGNITFEYTGNGADFFWLNLKGRILTGLSFGFYFFWYSMELFEYYIENIYAQQDGKHLPIRSTAKGGDFFALTIVNFFLLVFTLGLAFPWVQVRTLQFFMSNIWVQGEFDGNSLVQTEEEYKDASGDDMVDMLDLDLL
ncbi:MAG: YjgN family protein [Arcicella sp.]|jgi:uncharacterized membrane protein YjgN (DUF898 family)|nr:YjgN family protein [Arcicella sp.]